MVLKLKENSKYCSKWQERAAVWHKYAPKNEF